MKRNKLIFSRIVAFLSYFICQFAFAVGGIETTISSKLAPVKDALVAVGVITVTIALIYVGMKMVFQAAEWKDVAPVFWGGVLIGGAATLASAFIA